MRFNPTPAPMVADSDKALDSWVRGALAHAYAPVAEEQLPREWVDLVEAAWED